MIVTYLFLFSALFSLIADVTQLTKTNRLSAPVPLLTSWQRDRWTMARNHLLTLDPISHRAHLTEIESALFAVALDDHTNGADIPSWTKTAFCGHQGLGNGHNRWFDKSFTLIVENNGMTSFSGEHSPVDALIVSYIFDYMLQVPVQGTVQSSSFIQSNNYSSDYVKHLSFKSDTVLDAYFKEAQKDADETAALSDSNVLIFKDYGTDWVKKVGRVPPDAYFQMALQLAYYRIYKKVTATYETASTRSYLRGRTETIRTVSVESKAFVEAFDQTHIGANEKYTLLSKAANAHRKYTQVASDGHGCDRHLLVLRLLNMDHQMLNEKGELESVPVHPIFKDPIHFESQTWRLSTSGLHAGIRLMGTGFGAVYKDGYGINYMPAPHLVKFGIESKRIPETVSTEEFMVSLEQSLRDMRSLCEQVTKKETKL